MTSGQYITVRETAQILGVSEKKIMDLIEQESLMGYRLANQFLRLKKSEVLELRNSGSITNETTHFEYTWKEKMWDFFYYNDFYLVSGILILVLIYAIFRI